MTNEARGVLSAEKVPTNRVCLQRRRPSCHSNELQGEDVLDPSEVDCESPKGKPRPIRGNPWTFFQGVPTCSSEAVRERGRRQDPSQALSVWRKRARLCRQEAKGTARKAESGQEFKERELTEQRFDPPPRDVTNNPPPKSKRSKAIIPKRQLRPYRGYP